MFLHHLSLPRPRLCQKNFLVITKTAVIAAPLPAKFANVQAGMNKTI